MMSLLLLVSFYEFRQFLQIVLWIAVPATLVAIGLTIFFHYRRKKKHEELGLAFHDNNNWAENLAVTPASTSIVRATTSEASPEGLPDWLASANPDNTTLIKKYEHEVRRYRENYALLEQDFRELEGKYTDLRNKAYNGDKETDTTLVTELQQAQQRLQQVQEENSRLQQLVAMSTTSASGRETDSIHVLQQLLEQHIKNYHLLEHQAGDSAAQLEQLQVTVTGFDQQIRQLTAELNQQQQQAAEWQRQLEQSREVIQTKTHHIEKLERDAHDLQQHQALLQTEIADQQDVMRTLQEHLTTEQQKATALETKLEQSSQLLTRIYAELAKTINHNELMTS
jgi:chromosome segregation ATPase